MQCHLSMIIFFFFNDTATTEIYTLSLHDALPIFSTHVVQVGESLWKIAQEYYGNGALWRNLKFKGDRKSTRLNSSHSQISYAVFCLKKKKMNIKSPILYIRVTITHPPHSIETAST